MKRSRYAVGYGRRLNCCVCSGRDNDGPECRLRNEYFKTCSLQSGCLSVRSRRRRRRSLIMISSIYFVMSHARISGTANMCHVRSVKSRAKHVSRKKKLFVSRRKKGHLILYRCDPVCSYATTLK